MTPSARAASGCSCREPSPAISPSLWIGLTNTTFIGPIVVQYDCEAADGGTGFIRTVRNPQRPKAPTDDQVQRLDAEARLGLSNIKAKVEAG